MPIETQNWPPPGKFAKPKGKHHDQKMVDNNRPHDHNDINW